MEEKKLSNSKIFNFFDWVWRLMVLNVLTIIFSIGIITIVPAISATFKTIKDTKENYNSKIIKPFISNFVYFFRDSFVFSIILVLVIGVAGYGLLWYDGVVGGTDGSVEVMDKTWYMISLISITIVFLGMIIFLMTFIQIPIILTYFNYGFLDNIKLSFYMAFKYFLTTIMEVAVVIISVVVLFNALFIYHLMPIWLFFGISLPLYVICVLSRRFYTFMAGESEDDDEDVDYQNKQINRETYEDNNKTIKEGEQND